MTPHLSFQSGYPSEIAGETVVVATNSKYRC